MVSDDVAAVAICVFSAVAIGILYIGTALGQ
jgi:hypothetical protein